MSLRENEDLVVTAPSHTRDVFGVETFPLLVEWVVGLARENKYEALAACGHSGLLVAAAAAYVLRIPVIAVRKAKDYAKGDTSAVNAVLPDRPLHYAVVDDFVGSGETVSRIVTQVMAKYPHLLLDAVLLYGQNSARSAGTTLEWPRYEDVFATAVVHARHGDYGDTSKDTTYVVREDRSNRPALRELETHLPPVAPVVVQGQTEDLSATIFNIAPIYGDPVDLFVSWAEAPVAFPTERKAP